MATLFRSPLITRIWPKGQPTEGAGCQINQTNLCLTLPPLINPFIQTDWPNPVLKVNTYRPKVVRPIARDVLFDNAINYDWPNPIRTPSQHSQLSTGQNLTVTLTTSPVSSQQPFTNTWTMPNWRPYQQQAPIYRLPPTTGIDQFFGEPGVAPTYDWPNPKGYPYPSNLRTSTQDLVSSELISLVPVPFMPSDFPNPLGRVLSPALRGFHDTLKVNLLGQDAFPGGAGMGPDYDWTNPRGYAYPSSLRTFTGNANISETDVLPFNLTDFPNPRGYVFAENLRTFIQAIGIQLPAIMPFNLLDYPNPKGYAYPSHLRTFLENLDLELLNQDQVYGKAGETVTFDWPNPRGYKAVDTVYDPNFGWFLVTRPPISRINTRKTFTQFGTGIGKRTRRKDS